MNNFPFTLAEATDIAEDFEDLIDTDFAVGNSLVFEVNNVLICPYEDDEKKKFAAQYHETKDTQIALKNHILAMNTMLLLFSYDIDDLTSYIYTDIRTFVEQRGINYTFPGDE